MSKSKVYIFLLLPLLLMVNGNFAQGQRSGGRFAPRVGSYSITAEGGVAILGCDLTDLTDNYYLEPAGGMQFGYMTSRNFKLGLYAFRGIMTAKRDEDEATNTFNTIGITGHLYWRLSFGRVNPFVFFRVGGIFSTAEATIDNEKLRRTANGAEFGAGVGVEFHPSNIVGIHIQIAGMLTTTDYLDALEAGTMHDGYSFITLGATYYISRRR